MSLDEFLFTLRSDCSSVIAKLGGQGYAVSVLKWIFYEDSVFCFDILCEGKSNGIGSSGQKVTSFSWESRSRSLF